MGDQKFRINRENQGVSSTDANGRYPITPLGRTKPPFVDKVDGRARILRPLRPTVVMQPSQPSTSNNSTTSDARGQSSSMHHSQSMPVLQAGNSSSSASRNTTSTNSRTQLTLPSNSTEKAVALLTWAEAMKAKLEKMRQKSRKALEESTKEHSTVEDLARARDVLCDIAAIYNDMARTATYKCRSNSIFDKRGVYKAVEQAISNSTENTKTFGMFDKMQESMDARSCIEKNISAVTEIFRQNPPPVGIPRNVAPPPIKFHKHVEEANKGVWMAMDTLMNKTKNDPMIWRFKRISHPFFRTSKCLIEVHYCARRPSGEKEFVPYMKAVIVLKYGMLEDLEIGGEDEDLYDQERILPSKRLVYREFTRSAKDTILCSSVVQCTSPTNFAGLNNYIQSYVNCFSTKCLYCKKHLRQLMPPTVVVRGAAPAIAHKLCVSSQVPV